MYSLRIASILSYELPRWTYVFHIRMRFVIVVVCVALTTALDPEWEAFKRHYGKRYESLSEENVRHSIFEENNRMVQRHNEEAAAGKQTFFMRINKFSDLTNEEVQLLIGPGLLHLKKTQQRDDMFKTIPDVKVDDTVDWR
uniref:Cathepsin propeptide inhibitor domain-containing protein n=1 Tax=Branchiostoma floridae TaxID=7739 RepID=C3XVY2_BRAFL|eukprot:XP_002611757.1 hypothetical protein BRAFLDRAFT_99091 [Branchiostoma floridae]